MKSARLIHLALLAISLLASTIAFSQGANPPASTKESGRTSGHGQTAVEQTGRETSAGAQQPSQQVQQALIALDKQWGEAGGKGDTAALNKILSDDYLGVGPKGEVLAKQEQIAALKTTSGSMQNPSYTSDEYKLQMLGPNMVLMTHRASTKGTQDGKEVTESHRSMHMFQKRNGQWQVVANSQVPIGSQ